VQAFEDAGPVRTLLDTPGQGRILVVDPGGLLRAAVLGERMARLGLANGWRGVIVHGAVRDVAALAALDFAVLALGAVPRRAHAQATAETRHGALALGGVEIADGDWVVLDADGLVFVRAS
jgi:regulator of ribonuclease activity A